MDRLGDRHLTLRHRATNRRRLEAGDANKVLHYTSQLWGFPVELEVEADGKVETASWVAHGELLDDASSDPGEVCAHRP